MEQNVNQVPAGVVRPLTPEELEERRIQALRVLESSYDMYETSKNETIDERKNKVDKDGNRIYTDQSLSDTLDLMDVMEEDIITKYKELGGDPETLKKRKVKKRNNKSIKDAVERISAQDAMNEYKKSMLDSAKKRERNKYEAEANVEEAKPTTEPKPMTAQEALLKDKQSESTQYANEARPFEYQPNVKDFELPKQEPPVVEVQAPKQNQTYDEVTLPSRGECYASKKPTIKVSHLVAYDENLILSPGLYKNGTFLDHILKNKILDSVDPDTLIQGDRDAIIIWLRAGGYGPMYPIRMTDEETGQEFETEVDLSQLNFKNFTLKGDENGYFDFKLPNSGDLVKFRFLTAGDAKKLDKMHNEETDAETATATRDKIRDIKDFIESSSKLGAKEKDDISADLNDLEEIIYNRYKDAGETYFTHDLTNRLIMSTVSVNGISDRQYVMNYVMNMNLKDASEYRKYIIENEPGIDYNIKVKRPDSLGGGYIDTFLQLDQFIFVY